MGRKLSPKEAMELFQLEPRVLERLEEEQLIHPERTEGGHRRYDEEALMEALASFAGRVRGRPGMDEIGESRLWGQAGWLWEERIAALRGARGRQLLREMRDDPVIGAIFLAIEGIFRLADWKVEPAGTSEADQEAARFLESCMDDMEFSWNETIQFALEMLEQGFAILEIVYKRRLPGQSRYPDGRIGWRKLAPRPAETIEDWKIGAHGEILGAVQGLASGERVFLPWDRILLFRTTVTPGGLPEGRPIHRSAYIPWWYAQQLQEIEGIGIERDLAGLPVIYLGNDCTLHGEGSDYAQAIALVERLRRDEQAGVVIPKPKLGEGSPGAGILLELLSTTGRRPHDTSSVIERYDVRKALAMLGQFILLGLVQRGGSFALARQQTDLFVTATQAWLDSIADVFNRHAIPRLFSYNLFTGMSGLPRLSAAFSALRNLNDLARYLQALVLAEALTPDAELEEHLRGLARLPRPRQPRRGARRVNLESASVLLRRAALAARAAERLGVLSQEEAKELMASPLELFREALRAEAEEEGEEDEGS